MLIYIRRMNYREDCVIGVLRLSEEWDFMLHTLEDAVRLGEKIPGQTAIPAGLYDVTIDFSPHFQKHMPHVLNVPGFDGIRIHAGNTAKDTEGCILVGESWDGKSMILRSRDAYERLFARIKAAIDRGERVQVDIL